MDRYKLILGALLSLCLLGTVQHQHRRILALNRGTAAGGGVIAFVQEKSEYQSGFSVDTLAFTTPIVAGNTIIVAVGTESSENTVSSVVDNQGNTYALIVSRVAEPNRQVWLYYVLNATGGSTTITVTYSAVSSAPIIAAEFSGIAALDQVQAGAIGTTNPINPGTVTPSVNNALVFMAGVTHASATSFTPGTGLTLLGAGITRMCAQYEILTGGSGVAQNTDCTMTTVRNWSAVAATFKP